MRGFTEGENGELHLRSDFLLEINEDDSRNVPVAFILKNNSLLSLHLEDLPVFSAGAHARPHTAWLHRGTRVKCCSIYTRPTPSIPRMRWKAFTPSWRKFPPLC